jgi:hypothetical protein
MATEEFLEKNFFSGKGASIDGEDGIAYLETSGLRLRHGQSHGDHDVARVASCFDSLGRGEPYGMTKGSEKKWDTGALMAVSEIFKVPYRAHVEMNERKDRYKREKTVLEAGGSLRHKKDWLQSSSQSFVLKGFVSRYFLGWLAMIWSLILL